MSTPVFSESKPVDELCYFRKKKTACRDAVKLEWHVFKETYLSHAESLHWQPSINRRLSTELIKDNEKVKEVVINYVFY